MRSPDIQKLLDRPGDSYVTVEFHKGEPETVQLTDLREPNEREIRYGASSKRVHIRRFLMGGYLDTWLYPRDILGEATPDEMLLRMMRRIEDETGPFKRLT